MTYLGGDAAARHARGRRAALLAGRAHRRARTRRARSRAAPAATGVLVAYRWIVEQTVAATNTLTHGILGLPAVAGGLQRIIGVLFGGALLSGAGGVFGAFLVIIGVVFAAGPVRGAGAADGGARGADRRRAAADRALGDPRALASRAQLGATRCSRSRSSRSAGRCCSRPPARCAWTRRASPAARGGLPGHVAAAFAGLITFVIAVRCR